MHEKNNDVKIGDKVKLRFNDLTEAREIAMSNGIADPLSLEEKIYEVSYISLPCACGCGHKLVCVKSDIGNAIDDIIGFLTFKLKNFEKAYSKEDNAYKVAKDLFDFYSNYKGDEADRFLWTAGEVEIAEIVEVA